MLTGRLLAPVLDVIALKVKDIDKELFFYKELLNLDVLIEENGIAYVGTKANNDTLFSLYEDPDSYKTTENRNGLLDYSLYFPTRESFEQVETNFRNANYKYEYSKVGQGLKINVVDPEGNHLSICFEEALYFENSAPILGKIKLDVVDEEKSHVFYQKILGFYTQTYKERRIYQPSKNKIGALQFEMRSGLPSEDDVLGLDYLAFKMPNKQSIAHLSNYLKENNQEFYLSRAGDLLQIDDPNGIHLWFYLR
ncbi:hypothetical protein OL233_00340 [Vagococcus sp. PNs007]|uniref:CppA C-terminal domain-containing protein n=1 Tax=Vagococcus proximus TaxID=2991417 RepID=A0ABT5WY83_9ENTE|nr:CppA C-terminal domain-containing protein [Vagococcus proximus]MDF0478720.1 hypothetical protein [Vagococcus proximus]